MQELPKLKRWEKWALAALILALGLLRLFDTRGDSATKPDVLDYANATLQLALHIVAIWVVFNARRVCEWLFGILAEIMVQRGLMFAIPPPKGEGAEPAPDNETAEEAAERGYKRLLQKADLRTATEARRAKAREQLRAFAIDWLAPLLAFTIVVFLVVVFLQTPQTSRDFRRDSSALADSQASNSEQSNGEGADAPCLPQYCSSSGAGAYACRVISGADPTSIARDLLPSTATETEVARLAAQIWNDNRHIGSLANRTDRQIPENTELQIRTTLDACTR